MRVLPFGSQRVPRWSRLGLLAGGSLCLVLPLRAATLAEMPEMVVTGVPLATAAPERAVGTVDGALRDAPALRLAIQGAGGQTDMQICGSSFSGAGLALDGLALRNPQTEHFHLELPLSPLLFAQPQVLTGLDQALRSDGHLVGTVDLAFAPAEARTVLEAGVGEYSRTWQSAFSQVPISAESAPGWAVGAMGFHENGEGSDYRENSVERTAGGLHLQYRDGESQADLAAGRSAREFGARGFYGAPATLPSWEEVDDTLVIASVRHGSDPDEYVQATGLWRTFVDDYQLDRSRPWLYENHHRSQVFGGNLGGRVAVDEHWGAHWRGEIEQERLNSTYEGTLASTPLGEHRRERLGLLLAPEWQDECLTVTAGLHALALSGDRPAFLPVAGLTYRLAPEHVLRLAYTETVREPSYTELGYDSPGSLGDAGLKRQQSRSLEAEYVGGSARGWEWRLLGYMRDEDDSVDWIKTVAGGRWTATNLGEVHVLGGGPRLGYRAATWHAEVRYDVIRKTTDRDYYASRYVMDYPAHQLGVLLAWRPLPVCELRTTQVLARQVGNPVRDTGRTKVDGRVELGLHCPGWEHVEWLVGCDNLWDEDFQDLPGQRAAGRTVWTALRGAW